MTHVAVDTFLQWWSAMSVNWLFLHALHVDRLLAGAKTPHVPRISKVNRAYLIGFAAMVMATNTFALTLFFFPVATERTATAEVGIVNLVYTLARLTWISAGIYLFARRALYWLTALPVAVFATLMMLLT